MTGSRNLVPLVCGGSRFARLWDGWCLEEKFQIFISLWSLSQLFFTVSEENHLDFCKNWVLTKFGWKTKILYFQNDFCVLFIPSSGSHINFSKFQILLEFFSRVISISRGEQARNWAQGSKTQNFKVLHFKPNFRGRLSMTSEGTAWPHSIKKHPTNWFIHDSSEEHVFPQILSLNHTGSSKFSPMVSKFRELDSNIF